MRAFAAAAVVFLAIALPSAALAWDEYNEYWEMRYSSGLPGGGFGVTPEGKVGMDGAIQVSIPVAYTPCRGNIVGGYWCGVQDDWRVKFGWSGAGVNGTALLGVGFGKPEHGIFFGYMPTAKGSEAAYNVQVQLTRDNWDKPALAIGCQDISERRNRWRLPKPHGYKRSIYAVATGRLGTEDNFVYITLGYGTGRYRSRPFAGVSWPFADKMTLMFEYDGYGANVGLAHSLFSRFDDRRWNVVSLISLIKCQRLNWGAALTYSY